MKMDYGMEQYGLSFKENIIINANLKLVANTNIDMQITSA